MSTLSNCRLFPLLLLLSSLPLPLSCLLERRHPISDPVTRLLHTHIRSFVFSYPAFLVSPLTPPDRRLRPWVPDDVSPVYDLIRLDTVKSLADLSSQSQQQPLGYLIYSFLYAPQWVTGLLRACHTPFLPSRLFGKVETPRSVLYRHTLAPQDSHFRSCLAVEQPNDFLYALSFLL